MRTLSLSCFHFSCQNINTIQTVIVYGVYNSSFKIAILKWCSKLSDVTVRLDNSNIHCLISMLIECIKSPPSWISYWLELCYNSSSGQSTCTRSCFSNWQLYKQFWGLFCYVMFVLFWRWNGKIAKPRRCNTCLIAEVNLVMSAETSRCLHNVPWCCLRLQA